MMGEDTSRFRVGKVFISRITPKKAVEKIEEAIQEGRREYVCISTARTVNTANKDVAYQKVMAGSMLNTTDGMPLVWAARLWGLKDVERTMGPALFDTMLSSGKPYKHFLIVDR